jgi:hypothetical protein
MSLPIMGCRARVIGSTFETQRLPSGENAVICPVAGRKSL